MISGAVGPGDHEEETSSIWLVSILGGKPRRLRGDAYSATLSPDDSLVAYLSGHDSIMLADADGKNPREFIERQDWNVVGSPVWSSAGKRVVYRRVDLRAGVTTIESRGPAETTSTVLVRDDSSANPDHVWLQNFLMLGDRLVYARDEPAPRKRDQNLWQIAVDPDSGEATGEPTRLTNWAGFRIVALSASADGSRLVFGKDSTQRDVYVGELGDDGRSLDLPRRLTLDDRDDSPCCWTPDARSVVFRSDRYGNDDLFVQDLKERNARDLVVGAGDQLEASVTPDGSSFLYWDTGEDAAGPADPRRLFRIPVGGGPTESVLEVAGWAWYLCATRPNGPCLLSEIRLADGAVVLSRLDPVAGVGDELWRVQLDPTVTPHSALSPDGTRLALVGHVKDRPSIRLIESLTGKVLRDIDVDGLPGVEFRHVAWSADGNGLYLAGESSRGVALLHVDPAGEAHVLNEDQTGEFSLVNPSPDGRHLAFEKTTYDTNVWMIEGF